MSVFDVQANGLNSEKGAVIREKNADDLDTTNGEKDAVQEALNRLDTDTAPTLTHPSGVGHPS